MLNDDKERKRNFTKISNITSIVCILLCIIYIVCSLKGIGGYTTDNLALPVGFMLLCLASLFFNNKGDK